MRSVFFWKLYYIAEYFHDKQKGDVYSSPRIIMTNEQ